ncbi:YgjV family protein [Escherichia coli]
MGVIAFPIGITTFFNRDDAIASKSSFRSIAPLLAIFCPSGTYPAGASAILNAIRTLITLRTRSLWVMAIFIAC